MESGVLLTETAILVSTLKIPREAQAFCSEATLQKRISGDLARWPLRLTPIWLGKMKN